MVTASGDLRFEHIALKEGAVIVTTARGERRLDGHLPEGCTLLAAGTASRVDVTSVLDGGYRSVLPSRSYLNFHRAYGSVPRNLSSEARLRLLGLITLRPVAPRRGRGRRGGGRPSNLAAVVWLQAAQWRL